MKSWLRSTALAVASALTISGVPAIAQAAPAAAPAQQMTQAQLEHAVRAFEGATVAADGSSLTLQNGSFQLVNAGRDLQILDSRGAAVTTLPLKGFFEDSIYTLRANLSNGGKTVTLAKGQFESKATAAQLAQKSRFESNTKAWFKIYRDYADYASSHDAANFWGGTALGIITGIVGGWLALTAVGILLTPVTYILSLYYWYARSFPYLCSSVGSLGNYYHHRHAEHAGSAL